MNSNILLKLIKFGIGFVLFIPLYVGGSFFFPFIFPKIWLFQLVTEIILLFYVILAILDNRYRPKFNLVVYALLSLTIILIITGFTGIDAFRSFWGNTERMSGTVAWLHFAAFVVILSAVLKNEKEWRNFFAIAVSVSILEFFYVLAQYFEVSRVWMPGSQMGTIGNTDLVGTYAIFSAFFALYLWQNSNIENIDVRHWGNFDVGHQYFTEWLWAAAFFLNVGTLFLASSRGALLGFGAGIFIYLAIQFWQKPQTRKIIATVILIPVVLYGFLWFMRGKDFVKNAPQLTRIVNASFKDDTVQQRFTEWGIAWNAFKARPIFGFGPNNYLYLHNAFLDPRVYELRETNFDRAHNAYLDYASMSGILGLTGYVFLIIALFLAFFKNRVWTFASLAIAYAVNSFFVFDSPASYISLFLTIGFATFVYENQQPTTNNQQKKAGNKTFSPQIILVISIFYFLFSILLIWQVSIKPAVANYKFVNAFSGLNAGILTPENAFKSYKESLKYETLGTTEFRNQYITWLQNNLGKFNPENRLEVLDFGLGELEKEIKNHPLVFSFLNLGQMYSYKARGIQGSEETKQGIFTKAADAYNKALELAPNRLEVYYSYLQWSFDTQNHAKGVEIMEKAAVAAPNYWQTHWYLGVAHIANGNNIKGVKTINKALSVFYKSNIILAEDGRLKFDIDEMIKAKSGFAPKQEILGVVDPYIKMQMWPELLVLYLSAEAKDHGDIGLHQSLALVYQNLGLSDKFQEELKIVEELSKVK